jgi:beta-mannanase
VRWVWSPNVANGNTTPFSKVYPGDAYVDWVALDGYNWGKTQSWSSWMSFTNVFGPSYSALTRMTNKPVMIAEVGSAEAGGNKAAWIRQSFLQEIPSKFPKVRAVVWFDVNKETDWRVNSSSAALAAFKGVAASPRYQGRLP